MSVFKKIVSVLSIFCIIALLLYGIIAMPMIAGYKPWSIKDNSLGNDFAKNSLFYYKATDISEIEEGLAIIYSNGEKNLVGIVKSVDESTGIIDVWTSIETNSQGKNEGKNAAQISKSFVVGMAKSVNFPLIGGYFAYINSHVAIIILMGVILALRITFIYIDPEKAIVKKADESESFEQKFNSVLQKEKAQKADVDSIFTENKPEITEEPAVEEAISEPAIEEQKETVSVNIFDKKSAKKAENKIPNANDITNYINDLEFDSKDDEWYKADQVDEALDMITAQVYSALNIAPVSDNTEELDKLRAQSAEAEKKYLTTEAELAKANEDIEDYKKQIEEYKKQIENYKIMEQKVAKLVAAIRANKQNG